MEVIAAVLEDLSFRRVVGILDKNMAPTAENLKKRFPRFRFVVLPTDDVRSKPGRGPTSPVEGMLESDGTLKDKHQAEARTLIDELNRALNPGCESEESGSGSPSPS